MPDVQCLGCGYSLKGSPTPVCPECGQEWRFESAERDAQNRLQGNSLLREAALAACFLLIACAAGVLSGKSMLAGAGVAFARGVPAGGVACFMLVLGVDAVRCVVRRRRSWLRAALRAHADETD